MISTFAQLKKQYASKEITMDELRSIQSSGIVSFASEGISRSNRDCLQCVITFERLSDFIAEVTGRSFSDIETLSSYIEASKLGLSGESDEGVMIYRDVEKRVEVIATIEDDQSVRVDPEDVEAESSFQVFLRVQH